MVITNACFWHNLCLSFAPRDRLPGTISPTNPSSSFLDAGISLDVCAHTCKSLSLPARLPRQVSSLGMYLVASTLRVFVARESQERLAVVRPKYWSCRLKLRIPRSCCAADRSHCLLKCEVFVWSLNYLPATTPHPIIAPCIAETRLDPSLGKLVPTRVASDMEGKTTPNSWYQATRYPPKRRSDAWVHPRFMHSRRRRKWSRF